jgi:hypothetical protein
MKFGDHHLSEDRIIKRFAFLPIHVDIDSIYYWWETVYIYQIWTKNFENKWYWRNFSWSSKEDYESFKIKKIQQELDYKYGVSE